MQNTTSGLPAVNIPEQTAAKIMISEWKVGTAARQQASINAIAAAWQSADWPDALLSYDVHASIDGATLLHYSQWRTEDGFGNFVANHRDSRVAVIGAAVPDIERYGLGSFRLYRSHYLDTSLSTGCIVVIQVEADSQALQHEWIDAVITALGENYIPGLRAAHFHVCEDGKRIVNYAEWESEEAHIQAMREGKGISEIDSAAWQKVRTMAGIAQQGFTRYELPRKINGSFQQGAKYA